MGKWLPWKKTKEPTSVNEGIYVSGVRSDSSARTFARGMTPERLATIMRQADSGSTAAQYELFSVIEEDPHIHSTLSKRRSSVAMRDLQIVPADETPAAARSSELANEFIFGTGTRQGISNFSEAVYDLTDAIGKGFAIGQLVWAIENRQFAIKEIRRWPQRFCVLGNPTDPFDPEPDKIRVVTSSSMVQGEELEPWQWVVSVNKARSETLARAALLRSVCWFFLFKHFGFRDWGIFLEAYGMPRRVGKYAPGTSDNDRSAILQAAIDLGRDSAAIIPNDSTLEFLEAANTGTNLPFPPMVEMCNAEISKAILGGTLTTEVGATGGNRALGEVQQSEQMGLVRMDAQKLAETIRRDIVRPLVLLNIGQSAPIPYVQFVFEDREDLLQKAQRESIIFKDLGLPVDRSYLYESFNIPEPAGDDAGLLQVPASPFVQVQEETGEEGAEEIAATDQAMAHGRAMLRALSEKKKIQAQSAAWAKPIT